ncbi:hypothetical protein [uncultured Clostridium sp.]|uniref:hypothetical protein n=1 Tax=uncultured Clostridium sp. TaxID=59620 RepID=UPI0026373049|nr:hypothetical protein [uncultured Clostridium sp.]
MFSAFIQSCGASRAGISNQLAIADVSGVVVVKDTETPSTELKKYLNVEQGYVPKDSSITIAKITPRLDTIITRPVVLDPYNISLNNQRKIIDLLINKDNEVKHLRKQVDKLSAKTTVTTNQKNDALSMETVWGMGQYILGFGGIVIVLMIIQIVILLKKHKAILHSYIQTI